MIEPKTPAYRRVSFALAFGSFLVFCNLYLFQPMLPLMADAFSVSATQVNWLQASSTLTLAVCLVPWAVCSEMLGRRFVMLLSLFLLPVVGLTMLLSSSIVGLSLARGAMGVALAGFAAVAVAYMAEEFSPKALALAVGTYVSANSLGGIAGRIFGGVVSDWYNWQTAVVAMAVFSLLGALLVMKALPAQRHFKPQRGLFFHHNKSVIEHLKQPKLLLAMIIGGLNFALFVNLYSVAGFRLVAPPYNWPVSLASTIFLCYLAGTLSARLSGIWSQKHSKIIGMVVGTSISLLGMLVAYVESVSAILGGLMLVSFGAFFTHSLAYSWVSQQAKTAKATATALYLVHYYIGGSIGGFWLIYCWQHGGWITVIEGACLLYIGIFVLCWRLHQRVTIEAQGMSPQQC
ncbi:MFS transporter [Vibrio tapetis subsp. quintayensis]|uniref:MFS transporter n=1 Tax=Vibrio tapetis TaxID=52443 RepID=UPI0025B53547|nr:MFS transporter [Vibrio tapetis]MDN3679257.1 MFS transporter [Vibrio tapetis subsp. quintayensis]